MRFIVINRKEIELECHVHVETHPDEAIYAELKNRHVMITGNRRTDICMLAHVLFFEKFKLVREVPEK